MLRPLLLAAAVVAAASTGALARDGYRGYGHSRADAFYRLAASDGRITKDEWRIIRRLRAQEAYRGPRHRRHRRDW